MAQQAAVYQRHFALTIFFLQVFKKDISQVTECHPNKKIYLQRSERKR